jgi:predicted DNA binding protein
MSATIVPFPEDKYHPDFDAIGTLLKKAEETGEFFELAQLAFGKINKMRRLKRTTPADLTPAEVQMIANSLALGFFAFGRELGLPLETLLNIAVRPRT